MDSNNFDRITRALEFLDRHQQRQPDLTTTAAHVGLSPHHFQRLFKQWAGISPKRFQQYLSIRHARACLANSRSILDASLDVGLSSPGRLHDLFVSLEAVTPGQYKNQGCELVIQYGVQDSPFGACLIGATDRGICWLSFHASSDQDRGLEQMRHTWQQAVLVKNEQQSARWFAAVFSPRAGSEKTRLPLLVQGSNFQLKVWEALLKIPAGFLCSYQDLARWIGRPGAARAVGSAVGANPIAYLIPCHRVIRGLGSFGQYRWGAVRKQAINGWEMARRDQPGG